MIYPTEFEDDTLRASSVFLYFRSLYSHHVDNIGGAEEVSFLWHAIWNRL